MSSNQNGRSRTRGGRAHSGGNTRRDGTFQETGSRRGADTVTHTPTSVRRDIRCGGGSHELSPLRSAGPTPNSGRCNMPQVRRSREPSPPISSDSSRKWYFCGRHVIARGGGRASSIIRTGEGDVLPDTDGLLRHTLVGEDDNSEDGDGEDSGDDDDPSVRESVEPRGISNRKWIARLGKKFADGEVHRSVKPLLERHFDGPWVTFRKVPKDVLDCMFGCFRTLWRWDSQDDESIYEGFINVLKGRYRNIMGEWRIQSKEKAKADGHDIEDDEENFGITCKYLPDIVPIDTWEEMCKFWNTSQWLKRSKHSPISEAV